MNRFKTLEQQELTIQYEDLLAEHMNTRRQLDEKIKQLDQALLDDSQNLFGKRQYDKVEKLFSVRANKSLSQREKVLEPLKMRLKTLKAKIQTTKAKLDQCHETIYQELFTS